MKKSLLLSIMLTASAGLMAQVKVAQPSGQIANQAAKYKKYSGASELFTAGSQASQAAKDLNNGQRVTSTVVGTSTYSLQTNASVGTRITNNSDGTRSMTWTFSNSAGFSDRGTGYVYYNGTSNSAAPTVRVESERTGWPSIGVLGDNAEVLLSHTANYELLFAKRPVKGTGSWTEDKVSLTSNAQYGNIWGRMAVGGTNNQSLHVISLTYPVNPSATTTPSFYKGQQGAIIYSRSQDGGATWDIQSQVNAAHDSTQYYGFDGDSYAIDASGNTVAYVSSTFSTDWFLMKSTDNGTSWTKTVIKQFPFPMCNDCLTDIGNDGSIDTIDHTDASVAVLIDNAGMCHCFAGAMRVLDDDSTDGSMSYFPGTNGLLYWNESMGSNPPVVITGALDIDGNGGLDLPSPGSGFPFGIYQVSLAGQPHAGIDASGTIYLTYSAIIENTDDGNGRALRNIYAMKSADGGVTWDGPFRINPDDYSEQVYSSVARKVDGCVHLIYQSDIAAGHGIGSTNQDAGPNSSVSNEEYYVCVTPSEIVSSVSELASDRIQSLHVYPNPSSDLINVDVNMLYGDNVKVRLLNVMGQEVETTNMNMGAGANRMVIEVGQLPKGVYLLNVSAAGTQLSERIVVE